MIIGFIINRDAFYKYFGQIIDEALRRGNEVFCLHDYNQPKNGQKGYAFPYLEKTPLFRFGAVRSVPFYNNSELLKIIKENGIQVIVTISFPPQCIGLRDKWKKEGVFWVAIQRAFDILVFAEYLDMPDRYLIYSDIWLDWALYYLLDQGIIKKEDIPNYKEKLKSKVKSIGFPGIDQINMIDPERVRREWQIPKEKPVVLFLPFPFGSSKSTVWTRFIYGMNNPILQLPISILSFNHSYIKQVLKKWNDENIVKAVKKFCQNNNAYFLVKSREKDSINNYTSAVADKVLYDREYYPSTIMKCLSVADICINFLSSTVTEAIPMGVPNICILPPSSDWISIWGRNEIQLWRTIFKKANQVFDFEGVSYMLSIPQSIKLLSEKSIKDFPFNKDKQKEYIEKFIGNFGEQYSQKVLNEIEDMVNK